MTSDSLLNKEEEEESQKAFDIVWHKHEMESWREDGEF